MEDLEEMSGISPTTNTPLSDNSNYCFLSFDKHLKRLESLTEKEKDLIALANSDIEQLLLLTLAAFKTITVPQDMNLEDMIRLHSASMGFYFVCGTLRSRYSMEMDTKSKNLPHAVTEHLEPKTIRLYNGILCNKTILKTHLHEYQSGILDLIDCCEEEIGKILRKYDFIYEPAIVEEKLKRFYTHYMSAIGKTVERRFVKMAQLLKEERHKPLTTEIWGKVLDVDDAITEKSSMDEVNDANLKKYLTFDDENYLSDCKTEGWCARYLAKDYSQDGELFDFSSLAEDQSILYDTINYISVDYLMIRIHFHNFVQCQLYPHLKKKHEELLKTYSADSQEEKGSAAVIAKNKESKISAIDRFIIGTEDKKESNKEAFCQGMKAIRDNDTKARFVSRQIGKTISRWPSYSSLKEEGLLACAASTWSEQTSKYK